LVFLPFAFLILTFPCASVSADKEMIMVVEVVDVQNYQSKLLFQIRHRLL